MIDILKYTDYVEIYNNTDEQMLPPQEYEFELAHQSPSVNVQLPDCFLKPVFKELFGYEMEDAVFADGDSSNWALHNLSHRRI